MAWYELKILVSEPIKDAVSNRLFELGAGAVNETDSPLSVQGFFTDEQRTAVARDLETYFDSLVSLFPSIPRARLECRQIEKEDWADEYKRYYRAQKMTHLFFLKPAWDRETKVPEEMIPIVMEPGQAFGTGLHPSTCMAMRLMEWAIALYPDPALIHLLDVGTGSGILSIAAAKLGLTHIGALDIDAHAVTTAEENFQRNACQGIDLRGCELAQWTEPVDVLVSNILLETHKLLADDYRRLVKPGGQLILSGLLTHQRGELPPLFERRGFVKEREGSLQEWAAVAYTFR